MPERTTPLAGRTALLAGATSRSGLVAAERLSAAGARVIAVGRDHARLEDLAAAVPGVRVEVADLGSEESVDALAARLHADGVRIDGLLHLVGGWRGGGGLAGQSDGDYRALELSLTALRHVSRAFDEDLRDSPAGREAIVSSTAVERPLAGGANYAAVKAAGETWARAVGQGFAKAARDAGATQTAASVIFRVTALAGRESALADSFVGLWSAEAAGINGRIVDLSGGD